MATSAVGDDIQINFTFTLLGTATPADPTEIFIIQRKPDLSEVIYEFGIDPELTKQGVGLYRLEIRLVDYRRHYFRAVGTGDVNEASEPEVFIDVVESHFLSPLPS